MKTKSAIVSIFAVRYVSNAFQSKSARLFTYNFRFLFLKTHAEYGSTVIVYKQMALSTFGSFGNGLQTNEKKKQ